MTRTFARYQVLLGNAGVPSFAWRSGTISEAELHQKHYQAELDSKPNVSVQVANLHRHEVNGSYTGAWEQEKKGDFMI
ncbi:MAG: hypothetical protein HC877_17875 [Thioploca sp.]|nr:hypothetical protein [Thioploca sp.]